MADRKRPVQKSDALNSASWWNVQEGLNRAMVMVSQVDSIQSLSAGRIRQFNSNVETYNAPERGAIGAYGTSRSGYKTGRQGGINKEQLALPVCWSVIQALASEIGTQEPAPQFLTSGGDYKARKNAELLTNLTRGVAYDARLDDEWPQIFIDACVGGTGYLYAYEDTESHKIRNERVFPAEIVTDPNDDIYAAPRSLYRIKYVDRDQLLRQYPEADVSRLKSAKTLSGLLAVGNAAQTNMIKVYHGWHLPSGMESKDGRYLVATSTDSLVDEEYARQRYPIIPYRYDRRLMGYYGMGICELIGSVQNHLNELLFTYQQSMAKHGVPHWLCNTAANINKQELNDVIGSVIYWSGAKEPSLVNWQSMPADVMEMIQFDLQQIYQMTGVSLMAASAQKPAGLDSGEAIRAYVDTNSKRFQFLGKSTERWRKEVYSFYVDLALEIAEEVGSYPVKLLKRQRQEHSLEAMNWKDAKGIKQDEWEIECFPVSSLPSTPTGKLQYVKDLAEIGPEVLAPMDMVELLELPDTSSRLNLELAGRRLIERYVSDILDNGEYHPPLQDCMPLDWALVYASQSLAKAELEEAPAENLAMLRLFVTQVTDLQAQMQPPASEQPMAPPMPGPAPSPQPQAMLPAAPMAPLATVAQLGQ